MLAILQNAQKKMETLTSIQNTTIGDLFRLIEKNIKIDLMLKEQKIIDLLPAWALWNNLELQIGYIASINLRFTDMIDAKKEHPLT